MEVHSGYDYGIVYLKKKSDGTNLLKSGPIGWNLRTGGLDLPRFNMKILFILYKMRMDIHIYFLMTDITPK